MLFNHSTNNKFLILVVAFLFTALAATVSTSSKNDRLIDSHHIFIDQLPTLITNTTNKVTTTNLPQLSKQASLLFRNVSHQAKSHINQLTTSGIARRQEGPTVLIGQQAQNSSLASVRYRWNQMDRSVGESLVTFSNQLKLTLDELSQSTSVSAGCKLALMEFVEAIGRQKLWAIQTIDASAHILPSGLLEGTLTELGNFDQCLSIPIGQTLDRVGATVGSKISQRTTGSQYCSLQIKPPLTARPRLHTICQKLPALSTTNETSRPVSQLSQSSHQFYYVGLRLGICTPKKCARSDIQYLLTAYLAKYELLGQVKSCQFALDDRETGFDFVQQCIISAFVVLFILSALGTLLDFLSSPAEKESKFTMAAKHDNGSDDSETIESMQAGSSIEAGAFGHGADSQVHGKRWQYKVYRSVCDLHADLSSPGLQQNPLADNCNSKLSPDDEKNVDRPAERFNLPPCGQMLFDENNKPVDSFEESWVAQLERNQLMEAAQVPVDHKYRCHRQLEWRPMLFSFLTCFSLRKNLRTIGKYVGKSNQQQQQQHKQKQPTNDFGDIKVIHGIRTITMVWIIFGHTIGLVSPEMMNNLFSLAQLACSSRLLQALLNATLAVNTFFMISGLVTVVSFARKCNSALLLLDDCKLNGRSGASKNRRTFRNEKWVKKKQHGRNPLDPEVSSVDSSSSMIFSLSSLASSNIKCMGATGRPVRNLGAKRAATSNWPSDFQPLLFLLMRYLRLTPAYAAVLGFSILLPALGSGPFWSESVGQMGPACRRNWWLNLLYVNNFIETDKLCLIHSWYLSNDWQFYVLALLLTGLFYKSKKLTSLLVLLLMVASTAATFAITVANEFPPTIVSTSPAVAERWLYIHSLYYKPWPHLASYLVGLITGYLIVIKERIEISPGWRALSWILFSLLGLTLLNSIYPWNMGLQVEPLLTGFHSATFRTLWATCCAWLVFALVTRPQNLLAKLLSWHGFQITSRLTYCVYLVHPLVIYYHFGMLRERMDSSIYGQFHRFMATLVLSYLFAFVLSLLIEGPSIQLQNLVSSSLKENINGKKRRGLSECSTTNSWSATSSFGEQTSAESFKVQHEPGKVQLHVEQPTVLLDMNCSELERSKQSGHRLEAKGSKNKDHQRQQQQKSSANGDHMSWMAENSSALDADFQQKLAQAIGRGFKIRTRIANENVKQSNGAGRRATQMKRLPNPAMDASIFAAAFNDTTQQAQASKRVELSSFVASNKSNGSNNKQAQEHQVANDNGLQIVSAHHLSNNQHRENTGADGGPLVGPMANLNEMILMKQKLLSRSHKQTDVIGSA